VNAKGAMIPGSIDVVQTKVQTKLNWQQLLAQAVRSPRHLLQLLALDPGQLPELDPAQLDFPLRVPMPFVERMTAGDAADPLLLQVLPLLAEKVQQPGYSADPLDELNASSAPGIIHKYHGRVLLITTGACAVHCRYCFRRHFPYQHHQQSPSQWCQGLDYIRQDTSIGEVILSGGDPLVQGNERLGSLFDLLSGIPHLRRLRIHTRLPVVLPQRIDPGLLQIMTGSRLQCAVVIHSNHPAELDTTVEHALEALNQAGVTLLNQSVLLRGINDDCDTLCSLSEKLFQMGVLPYYLHLLDAVAGSAHFDVTEFTARQIYRELLDRLPGYLVPKLVRETPGHSSKTPIFPY
jgi:EF-P beta-lysylation protein EpmB